MPRFIKSRGQRPGEAPGAPAASAVLAEEPVTPEAEQVRRLAAIVEQAQDAILGLDAAGTITSWNRGAEQLYGYRREEALGRHWTLIAPPDHAGEDAAVARALRGERLTGISDQRVCKDGRVREVSVTASAIRDAAGDVAGAATIERDISRFRELARRLRASQDYTRSLIESSTDALMTTDPLGVITDVNEQMCQMTGCSREELIGSRFKDHFTEPARAEDGIRRVLREGKVANYELTARHADGHTTPVAYNAATFHDRDGRLQGVFAAARDITHPKALETRLRQSQAYNRGLIEASVDGLVTVDRDLRITDVNEQMCQMTATPRTRLVGSSFPDHFTDPDHAAHGVRETFDQGAVTDYELTLQAAGGAQTPVSFNASVYTDEQGDTVGIFASARDITERRRAEETRARLAAIVEHSEDAIVSLGLDGRITGWNRGAERLYGHRAPDVIDEPYATIVPSSSKGDLELVAAVLAGDAVSGHDTQRLRANGAVIDVSITGSPIRDAHGAVVGGSMIGRDITQRKRAEDGLRRLSAELEARVQERTRELTDAIQELEAFSYSVSHDLRAPLRAIDGFSQAVVEDYGDLLPAEAHEHLDRVRAGVQRMGRLIDEMLKLSRLSRGPMKIERVDLGELADEILAELRADAPEREVEVAIQPGLVARGDRELLATALRNLLENALKFTTTRPVARIEVGCERREGEPTYYVRDNGIGFDMRYVDKLFRPFERLHPAEDFTGTGIGLATVQRIVRRHGGRTWAQSAAGEGATFCFTLSDAGPEPAAPAPGEEPGAG